MMRKKFCCDNRPIHTTCMYEDHYMNPSGNGIPIFIGSQGQRGHGIGSVPLGLFRYAVPLLKRGIAFGDIRANML